MIERLVSYVEALWAANPGIYTLTRGKAPNVGLIIEGLRDGTYKFRPMYRTFIPKPKKPGEFRPITQPADKDRLVLEAMTALLNEVSLSFWIYHTASEGVEGRELSSSL